jgi:chromosome segregation ATPase
MSEPRDEFDEIEQLRDQRTGLQELLKRERAELDRLQRYNYEATQEIERLRTALEQRFEWHKQALAKATRLEAEVERLRQDLRVYKHDHWLPAPP